MAWYRQGQKALLTGTCVWASSTIKVSLLTTSYTPNAITDDFWDDVSAYETTVDSYTTATLGTKSSASDTSPQRVRLTGGDVSWVGTGTGETAGWVVVWHDTSNPATSSLLFYYSLGTGQAMGGDLTLEWNTLGLAGTRT